MPFIEKTTLPYWFLILITSFLCQTSGFAQQCPRVEAIMVNACGQEEDNEFIIIYTGSTGFNTNNLQLSFPATANATNATNNDINVNIDNFAAAPTPCSLVAGNASIIGGCTNVIPVGLGVQLAPNSILVLQTSAGSTGLNTYNFSSLCGMGQCIYVASNACNRTVPAFAQTGIGTRQVIFQIAGSSCTPQVIDYSVLDANLLSNGGYYLPTTNTFGNGGCTVPPSSPARPTPDITGLPPVVSCGPFTLPEIFGTNLTDSAAYFSGPDRTGIRMQPGDLVITNSTIYIHDFSGPCGDQEIFTVMIRSGPAPTGTISGGGTICPGQSISINFNFTGGANYVFVYTINGVPQPPIGVPTDAGTLNVSPVDTAVYKLISVASTSAGCVGTVSGEAVVNVRPRPEAVISGGGNICQGDSATLRVNLTGIPPFALTIAADGTPLPVVNVNSNTYILKVSPASTATYTLVSLTGSGNCPGGVSGTATVMVVPQPTAELEPGLGAACPNVPFSLNVTLSGVSPFELTYAIDGVPQPPIITSQSLYVLDVTAPIGNHIISLTRIRSGTCVGTTMGTFDLSVIPAPTAILTGDTTTCQGQGVNLTVNFAGSTGPYTFEYTANGTLQPQKNTAQNPFIFTEIPGGTTTYRLTTLNASGCTGTASGEVRVRLRAPPTATLTGGKPICAGGSGDTLTVRFTGEGPYTFTYRGESGTTLTNFPAITTTDNPYRLIVNPTNGSIFRLLTVSSGSCNGTVSGTALVLVFTPPTGSMTGNQLFCDTAITTVPVTFTGTGPFTFTYAIDGVAQPPVISMETPFLLPVNTGKTRVITLTGIKTVGCTGTASGMVQITVNKKPDLRNIAVNCSPGNVNYRVEFDLAGTAPFTLVNGAGTITGNRFVSGPILLAQGYSFEFRDALNCGTKTVTGAANCSCASKSGTMSQTPIVVCATASATVPLVIGAVKDPNDTLLYILHQLPGVPTGTIFAWSNQPQFMLQNGMSPDTTYYISAVVGNPSGGQIDLNDPCRTIALGTPVRWSTPPTAAISGNFDICSGDTRQISVNFTGQAPFNFGYTINGSTPIAGTALQNTTTINATLLQTTTYTLSSVSNAACATGTVSGQAVVTVREKPEIINSKAVCTLNGERYVVTFEVQNFGNLPGVIQITGTTGGTFDATTGLFRSDTLPIAQPYTFTVTDTLYKCGQASVTGRAVCACAVSAGALSTTPQNLCFGTGIFSTPASGASLFPGDTLLYALVTTTDPKTWTVVTTNTTPAIAFPSAIVPGTPYFLVAIAGNKGATFGYDPNDPCLSVATGPRFTWRPPVTAVVADTIAACSGVSVSVPVTFTGDGPFNFILTGGTLQNITANTTNFIIPVGNATVTGEYNIINLTGAGGCPGTADGPVRVIVGQKPKMTNRTAVCSPDNETYIVTFDITNADTTAGATQITGSVAGNFNKMTRRFTSAPMPAFTPYKFSVKDLKTNCGEDTIQGVSPCKCVTNAGKMDTTALNLCLGLPAIGTPATGTALDTKDTLFYVLTTSLIPAAATILATSATPIFSYNATTMKPETRYFIVAVAGNRVASGVDLTDPCLSVVRGPQVWWRTTPTALLSGTDTICTGDSAILKLNFAGTGPFSFTLTGNTNAQNLTTSDPVENIEVMPANTSTYRIINLIGTGGCPGTADGTATITVAPRPTARMSVDTSICPGESLILSTQLTGTGPFTLTYSTNGVANPPTTVTQSPFTISNSNIQQAVTYRLLTVRDAVCTGTATGAAFVAVQTPPKAELFRDTTICIGDTVQLQLRLSGADSFNLTISGGLTPIILSGVQNSDFFIVHPSITTNYTLTNVIASNNRCKVVIGDRVKVDVVDLTAEGVLSSYNGFGVSCPGENDGFIILNLKGNVTNPTFRWSNGATTRRNNNLSGGGYSVTITSGGGCTQQETYILTEPPAISATYVTLPPLCFGAGDGKITLTGVQGGSGPYTLTIGTTQTLKVDTFPTALGNFEAGNYDIRLEDRNGCSAFSKVSVLAPPEFIVNAGTDISVVFGDSIALEAVVTGLVDTFFWSPITYLSSPKSLKTFVRPEKTQRYTITIRDRAGCLASDQVQVVVQRKLRAYVPTIFAPDSNGDNSLLTISTGPEVSNIPVFRVYDRWGDLLFEQVNFAPNDPSYSWDGRINNRKAPPGVYAYLLELEYFDGSKTTLHGDVTIIR